MSKIFSIFTGVILLAALTFAQVARVDIPITVFDNAGGSKVLNVGLDSLATTGLDPFLDEGDLPPFPPAGAFEARWNLQPFGVGTLSTYKDYRNAPSFPYSGTVTHRLIWQYTELATQMSISYVLPQEATLLITSNNSTPIWSSGTLAGTGTYVIPDPDNEYSAARVYLMYDGIIPVELVSFGASVQGNSVNLSWQTATELNNSGFEIQRKTENSNWNKVGFVEGAGTTTESRSYSFSDLYSGQGTVSYRLKQIDYDGTSTYSKVINVDINAPAEFKLNQNYPNPFNPSTTVSFTIPKASNVKLIIYNQIGQQVGELVNRNLEAGSYNYTWNAANQSSGIYFYELQANEFKSVRKMTLIK